MKNLLFITIFTLLIFSCQMDKPPKTVVKISSINETKDDTIIEKKEIIITNKFTEFQIDSIKDITSENERKVSFIKDRLEKLVGNSLKKLCKENSIGYPPKFVLYRAFKNDREFEIWAGNSNKDSLKRLALLEICSVDFEPETKLRRGDGKTPEGFYYNSFLFSYGYSFMWIKLNYSEIDFWGERGKGSAFWLHLNYPNSVDRYRSKKFLGKNTDPGSAICIHANCVSDGCISFKNKNFLLIFLCALHHKQNFYGKTKIHIFPFRFTEEKKQFFASEKNRIDSLNMIKLWNNLEDGYLLFNKYRRDIKFRYANGKYIFSVVK